MKSVFKLSGTLLLNQFLANIACAMCVIPFPFMFHETLFTYILFTMLMIFFFYYISYHGAYKVGFHDISRHSNKEYDRGYLKRGVIASLIAASPSLIMFILWYIGREFGIVVLHSFQVPLFLWNMFGYWPIIHIIPNHIMSTFLICIAVQLFFPLVGYISGYKGIVYSQKIKDAFLNQSKHN